MSEQNITISQQEQRLLADRWLDTQGREITAEEAARVVRWFLLFRYGMARVPSVPEIDKIIRRANTLS